MKKEDFIEMEQLKKEEEAAAARQEGEDPETCPAVAPGTSHEVYYNALCPSGNIGRYSLSAAIIHQGSIDQGHYYTLAKVGKSPEDKDEDEIKHWIQLNDQHVSVLSEEKVLEIAKGVEKTPSRSSESKSFIEKFLGSDPVSSNAYLLFYTRED
jgi:hypothetical protein